MLTAKGYYCNYCGKYFENVKHRYIVETIGEWEGQPATYKTHDILCPECSEDGELEPFDYMMWSHLVAYVEATDRAIEIKYPLFDRETNGETYGYGTTTSCELLEEIADWYCIEVVKVEEVDGEILVEVDFQ